jgi:ribonuclease HI
MTINVFTDGGSRGNPGPGAVGFVVYEHDGEKNTKLACYGQKIGNATNNVAEYRAVIAALEWLINNKKNILSNKTTRLNFKLDSKLVVSQLQGVFKVKDPNIYLLVSKVRLLEKQLGVDIVYGHIPREENQEADFEVNKAFDQQTNNLP